MPTDKEIKQLVLNVLTEEQYASATKNEDELYLTPDTNDLYQHCIYINGPDQSGRVIDIYITVISSKSLNVDSLTDLKTLLGNTFIYSATGFYDTSFVYAINQNGFLINDAGVTREFSYAYIDQITYEDTVTTI